MNYSPTFFFTADEHYGHANIIKYCDRPFASVEEMDAEIIKRHNEMVGPKDVVIHAGDFTLTKKSISENYIQQLSGTHIFLKGSHDYWLKKSATAIWQKGNRRILCRRMSLCDAGVATITFQQLPTLRSFARETAAHRQLFVIINYLTSPSFDTPYFKTLRSILSAFLVRWLIPARGCLRVQISSGPT